VIFVQVLEEVTWEPYAYLPYALICLSITDM